MLASLGTITGLISQTVVAQIPAKKIYYYLNDHLGTPIKVMDETNTVVWSADYKPFAEVDITVDAFENNFRFPGQYYDQESDIHYNYHRYYQPQIGRYLRADPMGLYGGINLFLYANCNPINIIDPMGLEWDYMERVRYWQRRREHNKETPEDFMERVRRRNTPKRDPIFDIYKPTPSGKTTIFTETENCIVGCVIEFMIGENPYSPAEGYVKTNQMRNLGEWAVGVAKRKGIKTFTVRLGRRAIPVLGAIETGMSSIKLITCNVECICD